MIYQSGALQYDNQWIWQTTTDPIFYIKAVFKFKFKCFILINIWYDIQFLCSSFLKRGWTEKHNLLSCENAHRNNPIHRPHCISKITVFCVAHYSSSVKFLYMSRCSLYRKTLGMISTLLNDMRVKFNERHGDANIRQLNCMFKSLSGWGWGVGGGGWGWWWVWGVWWIFKCIPSQSQEIAWMSVPEHP